MRVHIALIVLSACLLPTASACEEIDIESLQVATKGVLFSEVSAREIDQDGQRRHRLLVTMTVQKGVIHFFNPFGEEKLGRSYRVSVIDSKGGVLKDIIPTTSIAEDSFNRINWLRVLNGGLIGKCHELSTDALNDLSPGEYALVVIVHRRMVQRPPHSSQQKTISDLPLDAPLCCSAPLQFSISEHGVPQFSNARAYDALDVTTRVSEERDLSLNLKFINPKSASLVIPGMNIFLTHDRPVLDIVTKADGTPYDRVFRPQGGTSGIGGRTVEHAILIPENGIVGGVLPYAGALEPGKYKVFVHLNESIYEDKLFVNGQRVKRNPSDWPVILRSSGQDVIVPIR